MKNSRKSVLPAKLARGRSRFERWRRDHKPPTRLGDLFMSLIHTCELNGLHPFDYLSELQKHVNELSSDPDSWMPWNYRDTLQKTNTPR
jgi:hypothetical protein